MSEIPIGSQFFVERKRNNVYAWSMCAGLFGAFLLYGLVINCAPRLIRKHKARFPRSYQAYMKFIRFWHFFNATFRLQIKYLGTFYIQSTVFLVLGIYIFWLAMMSWSGTADINYEPRYYIVGKKLSKVAVSNIPLLLILITRNDVLSWVTGWPSHHLIMLHIWMGRIIYFMIVTHVILTLKYWIGLKFYIMVIIPPQIIGMISFGCMSMLILLSPSFVRRLSYEFFLINHIFFSFFMLLAGFLHNDGAKAGILIAVHALVIDRIVSLVKRGIYWWCTRPMKSRATFMVLDGSTIKMTIPIVNKHIIIGGKKIKTLGNWKPGQHLFINVWTARMFEWHPYTIASLSDSRELVLIMKVYKGFTKKLLRVINEKCEQLGTDSCEFKAWFHGPYGSTLAPLINFDSVILISGGTGASFTFPVALDLINRLLYGKGENRCKRIRFVWYTRTRESLKWYEDSIAKFNEFMDLDAIGSVSFEIYITRGTFVDELKHTVDIEADPGLIEETELSVVQSESSTSKQERRFGNESVTKLESSFTQESLTIEARRPKIYELIESEIRQQCQILGEQTFKEIAVLSCGPTVLVNEVAFESERQERKHKNLSIYQYMEKYIV